ncbi:hypothetical protein AB4Y64_02760 [Lysobacter sp. TAF61]|uniref:hypothetical protein n=1 Tax=Lysobacter sp. TAF61 TaxID=3233072 RepID=UPI003F963849
MWDGDAKILLKDLLCRLRIPNDLVWTLYEFDGVTRVDSEMSALELEHAVKLSDKGFQFSPNQFGAFLESLLDINEIRIVGRRDGYELDIRALDSDVWLVEEK